MKFIVITSVVLAILGLCLADDSGKYRPEKYGNDGKYHAGSVQDGQYYDGYRNLYGNDNYYYRYNPYYTQQYYKSPYQQLLTPFTDYRSRIEQQASSLASVTSRPPVVVSTARPIVYTTPTAVPIYRNQYDNDGLARIVNQESDANDNSYHYKYLTENGISAEETGVVDTVNGGTRTSGFYEYIGDNGVKYRVDYTADENGFHPTGAHLP